MLKTCLVVIPLPSQYEESGLDDCYISDSLGYFFLGTIALTKIKWNLVEHVCKGIPFAVVTVISIHSVLCGRTFLGIFLRLQYLVYQF